MTERARMESARLDRARLLQWIDRFDGVRVAVHGDLVLDEFVYGEIARVSREAPVLILDHRESRVAPGGAANAAANLRALGARPFAVGRVGRDEAAGRLVGLLEEQGSDCSFVVRDPSYRTPVKSRILAGSPHTAKQQIVRIDYSGSPSAASSAVRARIGRNLARLHGRAAGLLIADYGYGSVDPSERSIAEWVSNDRGSPVVVDSRFRLASFQRVTAATPSIAEVEATLETRLPDDDLRAIERAGARLLSKLRSRAVVITRGSRGMSLFEKGRRAVHVPAFGSDEVTDVTGAGDTVAATFTLALIGGASFFDATLLANIAGGIVVTKRGTATVSREELVRAVEQGA